MIDTIYSDPDFLEHHGVKGMHWGVRKDRYSTSSSIKNKNKNDPYRQAKKQYFRDHQEYMEKQRGLNRELSKFQSKNKKEISKLQKERNNIVRSKKEEYINNYIKDAKVSYEKVKKNGKLVPYETGEDYVKNFINKRGDIVTYDDKQKASDYQLLKVVKSYELSGKAFMDSTWATEASKQSLYRIDKEADNYAKSSKEYKDWQKKATPLSKEEEKIRNKYR